MVYFLGFGITTWQALWGEAFVQPDMLILSVGIALAVSSTVGLKFILSSPLRVAIAAEAPIFSRSRRLKSPDPEGASRSLLHHDGHGWISAFRPRKLHCLARFS